MKGEQGGKVPGHLITPLTMWDAQAEQEKRYTDDSVLGISSVIKQETSSKNSHESFQLQNVQSLIV